MSRGAGSLLDGVRSGKTRVRRVWEPVCRDWGDGTPRGDPDRAWDSRSGEGIPERRRDSGSQEGPRDGVGQRVQWREGPRMRLGSECEERGPREGLGQQI